MSHQTGISANDELLKFYSRCKANGTQLSVRLAKIVISNEQLTLDIYHEPSGDWREDWDRFVLDSVQDRQPCYLLHRLDQESNSNSASNGVVVDESSPPKWILITWCPEDSPVRQKMLYASTKATLKKEFGSGSIAFDYLATSRQELKLNVYETWAEKRKKLAAGESRDDEDELMTVQERERRDVKREEAASRSINDASRTLPGLQFPIDDAAVGALFDFKEELLDYVQLAIDCEKEEIQLTHRIPSGEFDVDSLSHDLIPSDAPRYHLFRFNHTYDGQSSSPALFIYSVPGSKATVKQRMLYSSCKSALLVAIQEKIGIEISKRLEIDDAVEAKREQLLLELHPPVSGDSKKFDRPKGPPKRGAKRIIKNSNGENGGDA